MSAGLEPGSEFAGHRIEAELGRGGMGVVFLARHIALDRRRALKVLAPELGRDATFAERFRRESRLAAAIEHPNVVTIHHAGEEDGHLYLAMQYVEGTDLQREIARGPLEGVRVAAIVAGLAAGLDAAHARGLIHRDVKPANVLLSSPVDGLDHPYLTDFGISKLATATDPDAQTEAALTSTGAVLGTTDYMSPEQIEGQDLTPQSDVYALACVAFHALTGQAPFRRETAVATMMAHARTERPAASEALPGLAPEIDEVLRRGMAIEPADRPAGALAFAAALADAIPAAAPVVGLPAPPAAAAARSGSDGSRWVPRLAGALALLIVVGLAVLALSGRDKGGPAPEGQAGPPPGMEAEPVDADATIPVGAEPAGIAVGNLKVWVASRRAGAVFGIDPERDEQEGPPIPLTGAKAVAVGHGSIWAVGAGTVTRLDPGEARLTPIAGFIDPADIAVDGNSVWVTDQRVPGVDGPGPGRLVEIDPAVNEIAGEIPVGVDPRSVAVGEGYVWVANADDRTVSKVDPGSRDPVGRPIDAGSRPTDIAVGEGAVWVTDVQRGELLEIDPGDGTPIGEPIVVGARPRGLAVGAGSVWVASGEESSVWEIDPSSGELVEPIRLVGNEPADLAVGAGAVWTANFGGGSVSRIAP